MELTVWGLIFIPLSFILLLISPKFLISLLIFSLSLQRTAVINLPFSGYGLQLYRFLTILVTIYVTIKILYNGGRIKIQDVYLKRLFIILFAFLSYVIFIPHSAGKPYKFSIFHICLLSVLNFHVASSL
jgi:hypothetical protein